MELHNVVSSNLSKIGYDALSKTLLVVFNTGSVYEFSNVPEEYFTELMRSPSIGTFFSKNIRRRFKFKKVV